MQGKLLYRSNDNENFPTVKELKCSFIIIEKMINYGKQNIDASDIEAVINALKRDYITQGPLVDEFENDLNKYFKSKFSCAVSSGTGAAFNWPRAGWKKWHCYNDANYIYSNR